MELATLSDYPANEEFGLKIVEWGKELDRLMSYDELEKLPFMLDCFKTGKLVYDHNMGIRNIFKCLPMIEKTEVGFKVLKAIW